MVLLHSYGLLNKLKWCLCLDVGMLFRLYKWTSARRQSRLASTVRFGRRIAAIHHPQVSLPGPIANQGGCQAQL